MTDLAAVNQQRAPAASHHNARIRLPPKLTKAVKLLLSGECKLQKAAAARVGMNETYLCDQLSKPKVQAFIAQETRRTINRGQMRASARLIDLIDATSEHVSADVSKYILAVNGIAPPQSPSVSVNINDNRVGYIIGLADPPQPLIEHDAQDQAKPLILQDNVSAGNLK